MSTILVALAVSIDGMLAGFALGLRRARIPLRLLLLIALIAFFCVFFSMSFIRILFLDFDSSISEWIGGALLIFVGILSLRKKKEEDGEFHMCTALEAAIVGFSVAADASVASASLALEGMPPIPIAALMAATHFALVWLGNLLGRRGLRLNGAALRAVPSALLILLGILRLPIIPI